MVVARIINRGDVFGPYVGAIVCQDLSSRQPTRTVYGNRVFKVNELHSSKYALQVGVQGRRFDRITERLRNGKAVCCIPAPFCVCACTRGYRYARMDKEYELHQDKLLPTARSLNVTFQQKTTSSDNHLANPYRVFLQPSRPIPFLKNFKYIPAKRPLQLL